MSYWPPHLLRVAPGPGYAGLADPSHPLAQSRRAGHVVEGPWHRRVLLGCLEARNHLRAGGCRRAREPEGRTGLSSLRESHYSGFHKSCRNAQMIFFFSWALFGSERLRDHVWSWVRHAPPSQPHARARSACPSQCTLSLSHLVVCLSFFSTLVIFVFMLLPPWAFIADLLPPPLPLLPVTWAPSLLHGASRLQGQSCCLRCLCWRYIDSLCHGEFFSFLFMLTCTNTLCFCRVGIPCCAHFAWLLLSSSLLPLSLHHWSHAPCPCRTHPVLAVHTLSSPHTPCPSCHCGPCRRWAAWPPLFALSLVVSIC